MTSVTRARVSAAAGAVRQTTRRPWIAGMAGHLTDPLFRSAYSLMASTVLTTAIGFVFWIVAARVYAPETVGRDSALISSMMAMSAICQLSFPDALVRFLPQVKASSLARVMIMAYVLSGAVAVVLATAFVLAAPMLSRHLEFLAQPSVAVAYVGAVVAWGVFSLQDAGLTALRKTPLVPLENAVYSVLKIVALPIAIAAGIRHGLFLAWVVPIALLIPVMNYVLFRRAIPQHVARLVRRGPAPDVMRGRRLVRFLVQDYLAAVFGHAFLIVLPPLVVALLGTRQNAYFWIPFTLTLCFDLLLYNISTSVTVEAAAGEASTPRIVRKALRRLVLPLLLVVAVVVVGAPLVLLPFGSDYVDSGTSVLRLLMCAAPLRALLYLFAVIVRMEGRAGLHLAVEAGFVSTCVVLAVLLAPGMGLDGVALGWLGSSALFAVGTAPYVLRALAPDRATAEARTR